MDKTQQVSKLSVRLRSILSGGLGGGVLICCSPPLPGSPTYLVAKQHDDHILLCILMNFSQPGLHGDTHEKKKLNDVRALWVERKRVAI